MAIKRILLICFFLFAVTVAIVFSYRYYLLHKNSSLCEHIPAKANAIFYFNVRKLNMDFLIDKQDHLPNFLKHNDYFQDIKDIRNTGIDLLSDAAYVQYENFNYLLVLLNDESKFRQTIESSKKNLFSPIKKSENYYSVISLKDSFKLIWTKSLLVYLNKKDEQKFKIHYEKIFAVEPQNSFASTPLFIKVQDNTVPFWFYTENIKIAGIQFEAVKGIVQMDSFLHVYASQNLNSKIKIESLFNLIPDSVSCFYANGYTNVLHALIKEISILHIPNAEEKLFNSSFKKENRLLVIGGNSIVEKQSITYEYDDNFNRKSVVRISKDSILRTCLHVWNSKDSSKIMLCNFTNKNLPDIPNRIYTLNCFAQINKETLSDFIPFDNTFKAVFSISEQSGLKDFQLHVQIKPLETIFSKGVSLLGKVN